MLSRLIKKEILEHLMSLRFAIACVLCLLVILCSLFVRCQDYGQVLDDYGEESAMEKSRLDTMTYPWSLPWQGLMVYRAPNPLKIFVRGMDDSNGSACRVTARRPLQPILHALANTSVPLFPSIDLVAFVGLILSLMALVFGYDAVCGEKQRGTLRLMLSYSVPRHLVLVSKWIGGYITLVVPFLLTVLVGTAIVMADPKISLGNNWWKLAAIVGFALLYVAAIYSLSLYVSTITSRAATSVMLLLSIWVVLVLAAPNLSPRIARMARPSAGVQEVESARLAATKQIRDRVDRTMKDYRKAHGIADNWYEMVNWSKWEDMEPIFNMWIVDETLEQQAALETLNEFGKIDQRYGRQMDAQIELTRWIARASPFACFAMAATELSDAGVLDDSRYLGQLREFQKVVSSYAWGECVARDTQERDDMKAKFEGKKAQKDRLEPWTKLHPPFPVFSYVPPAAADYARGVAVDGGILAALTVLLFMLSYVSFLRYDVR